MVLYINTHYTYYFIVWHTIKNHCVFLIVFYFLLDLCYGDADKLCLVCIIIHTCLENVLICLEIFSGYFSNTHIFDTYQYLCYVCYSYYGPCFMYVYDIIRLQKRYTPGQCLASVADVGQTLIRFCDATLLGDDGRDIF